MRRRILLAVAVLAMSAVAAVLVLALHSKDHVHTNGATVLHMTLDSGSVHRVMRVTLVTPPGGGQGRPLLVLLHGRGGNQDSELSDPLFSTLRALGRQAPDIAFPYGGDHSYWHNRSDGAWGSYVSNEVIPSVLLTLHADPKRVAIGGISMGGFGAYDITRQQPGRFCAVGGHSAALWQSAGDAASGAFDDQADFRRHDVIAWAATHRDPYGKAALWLDGGDQDPFHQADEALAHELGITMHVWPGGHDSDYWHAHMRDYIDFYAAALARCRVAGTT